MTVINTNVKALYAQSALRGTERGLTTAMQQLSTGKRINSGKDDAAGMAISARMTQQIRSLNQAVRNAGDAIALIQTAEGATGEITDMMQRMRELAIQAINDTNSNEQRSYLDLEFQQLKQEIVRVSDTTEWNGFSVLDGTAGYRVGERPVYKTTSTADYDSVFVNPTTTRSITGDNAGETQVITFTSNVVAASGSGTYTVTPGGGSAVSITVSNGATPAEVASALTAALNAVEDRAYTAEASAGAVYLYYQQSSDNVATATVASSGVATQTNAVTVPFGAINDPTETFDGNGKFLKSGDRFWASNRIKSPWSSSPLPSSAVSPWMRTTSLTCACCPTHTTKMRCAHSPGVMRPWPPTWRDKSRWASCWRTSRPSSCTGCPPCKTTTAATSPWPSGAPAVSTARSMWSSNWPSASRPVTRPKFATACWTCRAKPAFRAQAQSSAP